MCLAPLSLLTQSAPADVSGSTESADTVCSSWCVWLHRVCCRRCWLAGWVTPEAVLAAAWSVDGGFGVLFACMLPLDRRCGWYLLRCVVILVVQPEVLMVLLHVLQTAAVPSCLRFLSPKRRQISALPFVFATTTKSSSMMTHCPLVMCKQQSRGMCYRVQNSAHAVHRSLYEFLETMVLLSLSHPLSVSRLLVLLLGTRYIDMWKPYRYIVSVFLWIAILICIDKIVHP